MVDYNDVFAGVMYDAETSYGAGAVEADGISLGRVTNIIPNLVDGKGRRLGVGEGRNDTSYTYGRIAISLAIEYEVLGFAVTPARSPSIDFLQFGIGPGTGSGTEGAPYLLTQSARAGYGATDLHSFSLWVKNEAGATDDVDQFVGCFIDTITLSASLDDVLKANVAATAQKVVSSASITTVYAKDTNPALTFAQGSYKWGQTPSAVARVQNFSLVWANNNKPISEIGSRFLQGVTLGRLGIDWTLTVLMTSALATTMRDDFYGQANSFITGIDPVEVDADDEIELVFAEGAVTGDRVVSIQLDDCTITSMSKPIPFDGGNVVVTFTGWAKSAKTNHLFTYYKRS